MYAAYALQLAAVWYALRLPRGTYIFLPPKSFMLLNAFVLLSVGGVVDLKCHSYKLRQLVKHDEPMIVTVAGIVIDPCRPSQEVNIDCAF